MKAIIKDYSHPPKRLYVNIDKPNWDFTKVKIMFNDELGWVMKNSFFGKHVLSSVELREIAKKLDEYNNNKEFVPNISKKWKQQKNSKNL